MTPDHALIPGVIKQHKLKLNLEQAHLTFR